MRRKDQKLVLLDSVEKMNVEKYTAGAADDDYLPGGLGKSPDKMSREEFNNYKYNLNAMDDELYRKLYA